MALFSIIRQLARPATPVAPGCVTPDRADREINSIPLTLLPDQFCLGDWLQAELTPVPRPIRVAGEVAYQAR